MFAPDGFFARFSTMRLSPSRNSSILPLLTLSVWNVLRDVLLAEAVELCHGIHSAHVIHIINAVVRGLVGLAVHGELIVFQIHAGGPDIRRDVAVSALGTAESADVGVLVIIVDQLLLAEGAEHAVAHFVEASVALAYLATLK